MRGKLAFVLLLLLHAGAFAQRASDVARQTAWVDSVMAALPFSQRVGQLFMVAAYSNRDEAHHRQIDQLVRDQHIGGLIFFQGGPIRQARLTNRYQQLARVPLLIGMDAEWGLSMRLVDSTLHYPRQMTLGALSDNGLIYEMGAQIARECRRLGVHVNFAPVVDINTNAANPVIGTRSFGENRERVAEKGIAYMKGMQHHGVMANAKHFPGHGDTDSDSHLTLPVVAHKRDRLREQELYPFRRLFADSLMSVMVAHLHVPEYDNRKNRAATLSSAIVTDLLQKEMGFEGLIFTDALNMKGVSQFYKPGEVDVLALLAGNDVLLFAEDVPAALRGIEKAVAAGQITREEIDRRVRKVLRAKYWAGLHHYQPIAEANLYAELNTPKAEALIYRLYEQAITVAKNDDGLLPFRALDTQQFASVTIGLGNTKDGKLNAFQQTLSRYAPFDHFQLTGTAPNYRNVEAALRDHTTVVVGLHGLHNSAGKNYGLTPEALALIKRLRAAGKHVVAVVFGNPYSLDRVAEAGQVVCAYQDNDYTHRSVPQVLFGAVAAAGTLPVTASAELGEGTGFFTPKLNRLRYGYPEDVGMNRDALDQIDRIAQRAVASQATPGCQVVVARQGTVVKYASYGHLSYDGRQPVEESTLYDIASVTKVAATLQAAMFLSERGLLDMNRPVSYYLPELRGTDKEKMLMADVLTHQAGLVPFIPHWKRTTKDARTFAEFYQPRQSDRYPTEVVPGLYARVGMEDSLWAWTIATPLMPVDRKTHRHGYKYSDLGFYVLKRVVEKQLQQPIEDFLDNWLYEPLGMSTMGFRPLERFPASRIAPTEQDVGFRQQLIRGNVHDQGAALSNGVGGHAGLFCNANDLAILMQMNLQNGFYGDRRYLQPETVAEFAKSHRPRNRRGLGWDRPVSEGEGPTSPLASQRTFGHSGFTGTCVWVDPEYELVYVFLSNRIHPDATNTRLQKDNVRTAIHTTIYESLMSGTVPPPIRLPVRN